MSPIKKYNRHTLNLLYDFLLVNPEAGYADIENHFTKMGLRDIKVNSLLKQLTREGCIEIEKIPSDGRFKRSKKKCIRRPEM